jgi:hypothetical protein
VTFHTSDIQLRWSIRKVRYLQGLAERRFIIRKCSRVPRGDRPSEETMDRLMEALR